MAAPKKDQDREARQKAYAKLPDALDKAERALDALRGADIDRLRTEYGNASDEVVDLLNVISESWPTWDADVL